MAATNALTALDEALARLLASPPAALSAEDVTIEAAQGRILADDLIAPVALPCWDYSAMDGYAFALADLEAAADRRLAISQRVAAGQWPQPLQPATAARIFTGGPIPPGADTVAMQESCQADGQTVTVTEPPRRGANIRRAGEDIAAGSRCLEAGRRLGPADLALIASLGLASVRVRKRLKVAVLSTGDELVRPGEPLAPGQICGSNNIMLCALLERCGCEAMNFGHIADTPVATEAALARAASECDLIVTSGGVSVGEKDHVKAAVEKLGHLDLWRLDIKPGKPLAWGRVADTPFVGLPGNPVSSFVTALLVLLPYVRHLQGGKAAPVMAWPVRVAFDWPRPDKRREFMRARVRMGAQGPEAEIYRHQGAGMIGSIVWMEGLVDLPGGQVVQAGDRVNYLSYVPYVGYVDFGRFVTADLAAIQVAKGFSSVAYGPNTLGGAINLISRKPARAFAGEVGAGLGQDGARQAVVNLGGHQGNWYVQAGTAYREADGFRLSDDFTPTATEDGGRRDNSYYKDSKLSGFTTLNLKAVWRPMQDLAAEVGVNNVTDENYELDYGFPAAGRMVFANLNHTF